MFPEATISAAVQHAVEEYPNESCGFVIDGQYHRFANLSKKPESAFEIDPVDWVTAELTGTIEAVIHSHPDGPACPTAADMKSQVSTGVPWGIIVSSSEGAKDVFWFGDQVPIDMGSTGTPPLVGRGFRHAVTDCYDCIRDWYRLNTSLVLPNFARDWEWWLPAVEYQGEIIDRVAYNETMRWSHDGREFTYEGRVDEPVEVGKFTLLPPHKLYAENFEELGFYRISQSEVREGDAFLVAIGSRGNLNHGGVYVGNGLALHHLTSRKAVDPTRLSKRDPVARWQRKIDIWLRNDDA